MWHVLHFPHLSGLMTKMNLSRLIGFSRKVILCHMDAKVHLCSTEITAATTTTANVVTFAVFGRFTWSCIRFACNEYPPFLINMNHSTID